MHLLASDGSPLLLVERNSRGWGLGWMYQMEGQRGGSLPEPHLIAQEATLNRSQHVQS